MEYWLDRTGQLNYVARLNTLLGSDVTPQNNAITLIWEVLGPAPEGGNPMPLQYFRFLGIPRPIDDPWLSLYHYLTRVGRIPAPLANNLAAEWLEDYHQRPWTDKEQPLLAHWLKTNDDCLNLIAKAAQRPRYFNPAYDQDDNGQPVELVSNILPHVQKLRELNIAFLIRAMLKLGNRDTSGAWQDF